MKQQTYLMFFFLLASPAILLSQWNQDTAVNLTITSAPSASNLVEVFNDNEGYFFCYVEDGQYKIHHYDDDGIPNWTSSILPNNKPVGSAIFNLYRLIDTEGNLIHISSFTVNDIINYCITKISNEGEQLWNGVSGIEVQGFVKGVYLNGNNELFVASGDNNLLSKYNSDGVLQWSLPFAAPSFEDTINVSILEKSNGEVGVVFLNTANNPVYGNYYYSKLSENGTLIGTGQIQNTLSRFFTPYSFLKDDNDVFYFIYTTEQDKAYVQKIAQDFPVYPDDGYEIDLEPFSIFQSAIIKSEQLFLLYDYYEFGGQSLGLKSQAISLDKFIREFETGNILNESGMNEISPLTNGLVSHNGDNEMATLILDKNNNHISYRVFDGIAFTESYDVCTTTTPKGLASFTSRKNVNASNSQVVIFFPDDRNQDMDYELYAQNIEFKLLGQRSSEFKNVLIYPNPSSSTLYVDAFGAIKEIILYDVSGKILLQYGEVDSIDVSKLSSGVYLLYIMTANGDSLFKKIIKD